MNPAPQRFNGCLGDAFKKCQRSSWSSNCNSHDSNLPAIGNAAPSAGATGSGRPGPGERKNRGTAPFKAANPEVYVPRSALGLPLALPPSQQDAPEDVWPNPQQCHPPHDPLDVQRRGAAPEL